MAEFHDSITDRQAALIERSRVFFVATADPKLEPGDDGVGPVNLSPKGGVPLRVISPNRVAFLDHPGSGNETARHATAGGPVTVMVCSFEPGDAAIVRLYGRAEAVPLDASDLAESIDGAVHPALAKARQVIEITIDRTMTSCGFGVPVMEFAGERERDQRGKRFKGG